MTSAVVAQVSQITFSRLRRAAAELELPLERHVSAAVEAALRLWDADRATPSVPMVFDRWCGPHQIELAISALAANILTQLSTAREASLGTVASNIATAAAAHQLQESTSAWTPRRWRPATVIHQAPGDTAPVTATLMGDPGAKSLRVDRNEVSRGVY